MKTSHEMSKAVEEGRVHPTKGRRPINMNKQAKYARGYRKVQSFWARIGVFIGA